MADSDNRTDYEKLGDINPIFSMQPTGKAASIYESDASKKPVEPEQGFVERAFFPTLGGAVAGAGLGALTKKLLPPPTAPTTKAYDAARSALEAARSRLQYFQNLAEVPADVLLRAQQDLYNANLRVADISRELGEIPRPAAVAPPAVAAPATPEAPPSRKIAGSSEMQIGLEQRPRRSRTTLLRAQETREKTTRKVGNTLLISKWRPLKSQEALTHL